MASARQMCGSDFAKEALADESHAATHCNMLQHAATRCNTLPDTGSEFATVANALAAEQHAAIHCNTLQHTATHCSTLATGPTALAAEHTLQHTTTHCSTLQHTTTEANTLAADHSRACRVMYSESESKESCEGLAGRNSQKSSRH